MTGGPTATPVHRRRVAPHELAVEIAAVAAEAIRARGRFHVVLAGGTSPAALYRCLRDLDTDWSGWWVVPSDERCLPVGDPDRNDTMLRALFADHVGLGHLEIFEAERGPVDAANRANARMRDVPTFDLVVLGLGDDGHTASLFDDAATRDLSPAVAVSDAPKPPAERVSLGAARLSHTRRAMFIVPVDRAWAIEQLLAGGPIAASVITAPVRELVHLEG